MADAVRCYAISMKDVPYPAPDFSLANAKGDVVSLADYAGKWLVVYFYPKDNTPGCTTEACSIRDVYDEMSNRAIRVVGISADSVASHEKFAAKHKLNFELLSDPDGSVAEAYGVRGNKLFGSGSVQRKTFVINPQGEVVRVYGRVTPAGHGDKLLEDIDGLQAASGAYGAGSF